MTRLQKRTISAATLLASIASIGLATAACGGSKPPPPTPPSEEAITDAGAAPPPVESTAAAPGTSDDKAPKATSCGGADVDLMAALIQSACEVPNAKPDEKPRDVKGTLEVTVAPSATKVSPGGHVDLVVTFVNKGKDPLPLDFILDPTPRFTVEAYDTKGKRVDMPSSPPPVPPGGMPDHPPTDQGTARITLTPNGSAHVKLAWTAQKMKWAPEKIKGTPPEAGFPRTPSGPLGKGKYSVRVVTPLTNVAEGSGHEVSAPKANIEVGR